MIVLLFVRRLLGVTGVALALGSYVVLWFSFNAAVLVVLVAAVMWLMFGVVDTVCGDVRDAATWHDIEAAMRRRPGSKLPSDGGGGL